MAKTKSRPAQLKQYYVLKDYKESLWKKGWKEGEIIIISIDEAAAYIGPKIITPLRTALDTKQYVPDIEIASYKKSPLDPIIPPAPPAKIPTPEPEKKTLVKNTLKSAVQEKKAAFLKKSTPTPSTPKVDEPTTSTPPETKEKQPELSAAEKAIQAKIAAAKKKK